MRAPYCSAAPMMLVAAIMACWSAHEDTVFSGPLLQPSRPAAAAADRWGYAISQTLGPEGPAPIAAQIEIAAAEPNDDNDYWQF
jgi:hypothetical protein